MNSTFSLSINCLDNYSNYTCIRSYFETGEKEKSFQSHPWIDGLIDRSRSSFFLFCFLLNNEVCLCGIKRTRRKKRNAWR